MAVNSCTKPMDRLSRRRARAARSLIVIVSGCGDEGAGTGAL
jgi:hypothetical protein